MSLIWTSSIATRIATKCRFIVFRIREFNPKRRRQDKDILWPIRPLTDSRSTASLRRRRRRTTVNNNQLPSTGSRHRCLSQRSMAHSLVRNMDSRNSQYPSRRNRSKHSDMDNRFRNTGSSRKCLSLPNMGSRNQ